MLTSERICAIYRAQRHQISSSEGDRDFEEQNNNVTSSKFLIFVQRLGVDTLTLQLYAKRRFTKLAFIDRKHDTIKNKNT